MKTQLKPIVKARFAAMSAGLFVSLGANAAFISVEELLQYGYVQYGDALSVSLPISAYLYSLENGGVNNNDNPYYVQSAPGQISDLVVVATGSSGQPVTTNFDGQDKAYATPTSSGTIYWSTDTTAEPGVSGGTINNNLAWTWDASLSSLQNFLNGDDPIFFFNNNETNSGSRYDQSLAAWARIWITDPDGTLVGNYFDFTNMGGAYKLITEGGGGNLLGDPTTYTSTGAAPLVGTNAATDFVLSGGQVCLQDNGAGVPPGPAIPCPAGHPPALTFDHNLGQNQAAYALVFPEFNALLRSLLSMEGLDLGQYTFHADIKLGCHPDFYASPSVSIDECEGNLLQERYARSLSNGYEQIFIRGIPAPTTTEVPEPGSLALMGLGLAALGLIRRRKLAAA